MTVSTTSSATIALGNGSTSVFSYSFICDAATNLEVIYTDTDGLQTLLESSQYTLFRNPPATNSLHSIGGTVTYTIAGSPIASGTSLTIRRTVPLTQQTSISNQGAFYPQVTEEALDEATLQIQQVSARTGQIRGTWAGGVDYNFGDIVQDGTNGANTLNYYQCAIANTSATWSTDLAAGDWALAINIQQTSQYADDAAASAAAALVSQNAAASSASSASTSASTATTQAGIATSAASTATTQAANAATSASNASTSASSASTSASSASTSASTASTAATTATTQAGIATTQAGNAATSATNAANSAVAAAASASVAAGSLIGTSTTSNAVGTGSKTFTTQSGLAIPATGGNFIIVSSTADPANYMHGQVTSYSGTTLVLDSLDIGGTGTFASWNIVTSSPQGPAGIGAGTVSSGTSGQMTYYAATGDTVSGNANARISNGALTLGTATSVQGSLLLSGSTSGTTTLAAPVAGTGTMTLQAGSDTLTGRATTDTLTNKTFTSATNVLGGVTATFGSDDTGDIYYRSAGGVLTRLANGGVNTVLHGSGSTPSYSAVVEGDLGLTDITTANVTSTAHGFAPKSPADATYFLNGAATPVFVQINGATLVMTDVTTNDVTSSAHGFAPKTPGSATQFLNGAATAAFAAVKDSDLSVSDVTTNNATTSAHGFLKKLSNSATQFMDGTGNWSTPAGGSTTLGAVGTYLLARAPNNATASGSTTAGGNLTPVALAYNSGSSTEVGNHPSGTWRNMGGATAGTGEPSISLWVRTV